MKKRIVALLTCILLVLSILFAPSSDAGSDTLNITNQSKTIDAGKSFHIKLNGLKPTRVKWTSSKKSVATVDKRGIVRGIRQGKAKITGTYKGISFVIAVTVNDSNNVKYFKTLEYDNTIFKVAKARILNEGKDKYVVVGGLFQNNKSTPSSCGSYYEYSVYINGIQTGSGPTWGFDTSVKDGAQIDAEIPYRVENGDKVEITLISLNTMKTIYSETINVNY